MKHYFKRFIGHPLITGSFIIFTGSLLANIFNFLFNLFMASNLAVVDYGILASLISIITLSAYAGNALIPAVLQFAGKYFAQNDIPAVVSLYRKSAKFLSMVSIFLFISFIIFINQIQNFFRIPDLSLLIMTDFIIFIGFFIFLNMALIQAKLAFHFVAFFNILTSFSKLLFGVFFVSLGYATHGAITALLLSSIIPFVVTFIPIRFIFEKYEHVVEIKIKEIVKYGIPAALGLLALASFITTDLLLVKHYFNDQTAGMYAGLSLVGKVVFYFTAPISSVMFPLVVQKHSKKENSAGTFFLALTCVLLTSIAITIFYILFPKFVILLFIRRNEYLTVAPLLGLYALYITIYAALSVLVNFYFSIRATKIFIPIVIAAVLQIFFISLYHKTLTDIIYVSIIILSVLFLLLSSFYPLIAKQKNLSN